MHGHGAIQRFYPANCDRSKQWARQKTRPMRLLSNAQMSTCLSSKPCRARLPDGRRAESLPLPLQRRPRRNRIEANVDAIVEAVTAKFQTKFDEQAATITQLQAQLTKSERGNLIASEAKKLGLNEADMEFVTIPDDADVAEYLGRYKQSLVNRGLKPAETTVTAEQKQQQETELAKELLAECEVK
nr:MAG TPA: hypothetical protein [Bacteriophage sp.]